MSDTSTIEWTDATWNPVTGCTEVSEGCDHCYAKTFAERWRGIPGHPYEQGFDLKLWPERLDMPLRWRQPRRVFVNSMSDLFHDGVPDEFILRVFTVMRATPQHTYQVLTKRPGRMASFMQRLAWAAPTGVEHGYQAYLGEPGSRPLPNVWLGTSVETQKWADVRIPKLLETPAAVRFLSCEPLLGPLALRPQDDYSDVGHGRRWLGRSDDDVNRPGVDWVIVGGESGPNARPMHPDWVRAIRDQAALAQIAFFFKQWGEHLSVPVVDDPQFAGGRAFNHPRGGRVSATVRERSTRPFTSGDTRPLGAGDRNGFGVMLDDDTLAVRIGKKAAGRELDGRTWDEYPAVTP